MYLKKRRQQIIIRIVMKFNMSQQKGQIAILIPILLLVAGLFLFNINLPKSENNNPSQNQTPMIGEDPPNPPYQLNLPAIRNFSEGNGPDGTFRDDGGPDSTRTKTYRLVRVKVPVDRIDRAYNNPLFPREYIGKTTEHFVRWENKVRDGVTFEVYYPNQYGESTLDGQFQWKYNSGNPRDLQFHQEGFLFFVRLKPNYASLSLDDQPEQITGIDRRNQQSATFYLVDLYQEESRYQASLTGERGYKYEDVFKYQGGSANSITRVAEYPTGTASGDDKQLQLKHFVIKTNVANTYGFSAHCKPAIYLYPQKIINVNVQVNTKGELLYTDPLYPLGGWDVTAYPDGRIVYQGKNFDYLYYESRIPDSLIEKPGEGFVVAFIDLPNLYDAVLPQLGLSAKQVFDFKEYWQKTLPKSNYYFVGIMAEKNIDSFDPLAISPKPDSIIRVRFYFEALEKKIEVKEPKITTPKKNGFTVVEWGGMVKTDKEHPFTCSQ